MPAPPEESSSERRLAQFNALLLTLGGPGVAYQVATQPRSDIPVTVLSGFLGAGKTTLLRRLLTTTSEQIVAIVNDVAAVNVDAALVRSSSAETLELVNGCACCVLSSDLADTLTELAARATPPAAVVIEASGIADPMGIAQTVGNVVGVTLDGVVTVVDALTCEHYLQDPLTAGLFERQLAAAHLVALTKTAGCADEPHMAAVMESLALLAPGRPVVQVDAAGTAADVLLGAAFAGARPTPAAAPHSYAGFAVAVVPLPVAVDAAACNALLDAIPACVLRIKGALDLLPGVRHTLQAAGPRWRLTPATPGLAAEVVIIGRATDPRFAVFVADVRGLGATPTQA